MPNPNAYSMALANSAANGPDTNSTPPVRTQFLTIFLILWIAISCLGCYVFIVASPIAYIVDFSNLMSDARSRISLSVMP